MLKLILAAWLPITSDEAYYVLWGKYIDYGYYDHFPMAGWIANVMLKVGHNPFIVRLPVIFLSTLLGFLIYKVLEKYDKEKAELISIFYFISPLNFLSFIHDPTTPLMFFMFLSVYLFFIAEDKRRYELYFLSGLMLGGAILSKYFAVFLVFIYLFYFFTKKSDKIEKRGFLLLILGAVPSVLILILWNYHHNWINLNFLLNSKNKSSGISLGNFFVYMVTQLYLLTPIVLYFIAKDKFSSLKHSFDNRLKIFGLSFYISSVLFTIFSFKIKIGLHWIAGFYPFFYILCYNLLSKTQIKKSIKFMSVVTAVHLLIIFLALLIPLKTIEKKSFYKMVVLGKKSEKVVKSLEIYKNDFYFTSTSYSRAAVLGFYMLDKDIGIFGQGSKYGRVYDMVTDYRSLNNQNILIFDVKEPKLSNYRPYFSKIEVKEVVVEKATYYVILGYNFNYGEYEKNILREIYSKYYDFDLLKILPYDKKFKERF